MSVDFEPLIRVKHDDPGIARQGRIFNILLLCFFFALLTVSCILTVHHVSYPNSAYGHPTLFNGILVATVIICSYILSLRGHVKLGVVLFLMGLLVGTTIALVARGDANAIILIFPITIITAGLILGPRSAFIFAVLSILFYGLAEYILQINGTILFDDHETLRLNNFLAVIASMFVVAVVTWLFTSSLRNYVRELENRDREKEILLKEIHHRVKNNLQIISSLLNLQGETLKEEEARKAFKESTGRIKSMALIHERLYRSKDLSSINIRTYIDSLVGHIINSQSGIDITVSQDIEELSLDVDFSLSLGLIINELVTNSTKYAFPADWVNEEPKIGISFGRMNGDMVLRISDNGKGMGKNVNLKESESLGLQIVETLAQEHGGEVVVSGEKGTEFIITFKRS